MKNHHLPPPPLPPVMFFGSAQILGNPLIAHVFVVRGGGFGDARRAAAPIDRPPPLPHLLIRLLRSHVQLGGAQPLPLRLIRRHLLRVSFCRRHSAGAVHDHVGCTNPNRNSQRWCSVSPADGREGGTMVLVTLYVVHVTRAPAACARIPLVSDDRINASPRACLPLARESRSSLATASSRRRARVQKKEKEKMGEGAGAGGGEKKIKKMVH